jgi:hypothetical protein
MPTNSTAVNAVDVFAAQYDSTISKMRVISFMKYNE